jgi:hypothetical protein
MCRAMAFESFTPGGYVGGRRQLGQVEQELLTLLIRRTWWPSLPR